MAPACIRLRLLFRDEQRKILNLILEEAIDEARVLYRNFHDEHAHLIRFVTDLGVPLPQRFRLAVDFTLNSDLLDAFSGEVVDLDKSRSIIEEIKRTGVKPDAVTLEFSLRRTIDAAIREIRCQSDGTGVAAAFTGDD